MKKWINILFFIINFFIFGLWIWFKFIRERLPREIPFNLSLISTIILLLICLTYLYALYRFILSLNKIVKVKAIVSIDKIKLFINNFFDKNTYFDYYARKVVSFLIKIMTKFAYALSSIQYLIRIILAILFLIDFYSGRLHYIYIFVYLYVIIYLIQLYIYLCIRYKEKQISFLSKNIYVRENNVGHIYDLRQFINILTIYKKEEKPFLEHSVWLNDTFIENVIDQLRKENRKPVLDVKKHTNFFTEILYSVVDINYIIYIYYHLQKKDRIIDICLSMIYAIGWTYILFVSINTFHFSNIEIILLKTWQDIYEPFSNLPLKYDDPSLYTEEGFPICEENNIDKTPLPVKPVIEDFTTDTLEEINETLPEEVD